MKKTLVLVAWSLVLISGLCGDFSINESPNGHVYNPRYDQCETYSIVPATASSIIVSNLEHNPTMNATVIHSTGSVEITIEDIAGYSFFKVFVDGNKIGTYATSGHDISFERQLNPGIHTIKADWANIIGQTDSFSFDFDVSYEDHYYQNSYAKLFVCTNGVSEYGAVRPALFVEGFSVPGIMSGGSEYTQSLVSKWKSSLSGSKIYMLSLNNPTQDVRDNAMVVIGALRFIHSLYFNQLVEGTSVYGYSMGGILARYALAYAEQWNIPHFCTQYVSLDSPHRGASMNLNMQNTMQSLMNVLDGLGQPDSRLDAALLALDSPAAKQLIRENRYADNNDYGMGSNQYRNFFAEINEEDNIIHEIVGYPMSILNENYDSSYEGTVKPGFPYKQNDIKCLAYSNGGLELSGNINDEQLAASWSLDVAVIPNYDGEAAKCGYDRQPGSVFEDFSTSRNGTVYDFELTQNYAPVLVPTRSSLYLKRNSISGGSPVPEFDINLNYLSSLTEHSNILLDHTYFDQIVYAPNVPSEIDTLGFAEHGAVPHYTEFDQWNWRHGELGWRPYSYDNWVGSNIATSTNWLNQIDNRTVCTINGQVNGTDLSGVSGTMLINGVENRAFAINPDGSYQIPYLYTQDALVRILIEKPGCIPSHQDIPIVYNNAMLQDYSNASVNMFAFNLNDIRVSNAGSGSFTTINAALGFICEYVGSGLYTGEPIRIRVLPGTYPESVDLSPLAALGITDFALEGAGDVTINGDVYGIKLVVNEDYPCDGAVYNIKDIKVTGSDIGILFKDFLGEASGNVQAPQLTLHVQGCTVYNCSMGTYPDTSLPVYSAAGIHFEGAGSIEDCNMYDNQATGSSVTPPEYCQAGGLFVRNNSSSVTEVLHNTFSNNQGGLSGGLVAKGTGQIRISNMNTFTGNTISTGSSLNAIPAHAMSVYDASDVTIKNNLFIDNLPAIASGTVIGLLTYVSQAASPIIFANNTILNTPLLPSTGFSAITFKIMAGVTVQDIQIRNNIISVTDGFECSISSLAGFSPVNFDYNMLHNTSLSGFSANLYDPTDPTSVYNPSAPRFNYQCDPQLDSNYAPIWDQYTMSPCIDNAHPDTDGDGIPWNGDGVNFKNDPDDIDSDGTCLDIGSIPAVQHDYEDYPMPVSGNIKWMSFPVLNGITGGYTTNSNFFEPIVDDLILDWVEWKPEAGQKIIMKYVNMGLQNGTQSVTSPVGYKVKLKNEVTNQIKLETPGFIQAPATAINLYRFQSGTTTVNENWIGYFQRTSSHPFNAFATILNYVTSIRTQYWSMARMPKTGVWIMTPGVPVINYGDMVIVTVSQDCSFTWNDSAPVDPKVRDKAVEFEFTEKPDYTALYLDLASLSEIPSEIGVYIDGTCKGAVKVESSFTDICVYLEENEALSAENCELVLYYAPKSAPDYRKTCKPGADDISRVAESGLNFYTMKLTSDSELNPVIPKTALRQNYPNPFNPTTTIDYELAETGSLRIEIYNVKGQKVTTLVDCAKTSGPHRVIWNGTDKFGRAVSSGIYHYRLISKDKSITKKMLLLK